MSVARFRQPSGSGGGLEQIRADMLLLHFRCHSELLLHEASTEPYFGRPGITSRSLVAVLSSAVRGYSHHSLGMPAVEGRELGQRALAHFLPRG